MLAISSFVWRDSELYLAFMAVLYGVASIFSLLWGQRFDVRGFRYFRIASNYVCLDINAIRF